MDRRMRVRRDYGRQPRNRYGEFTERRDYGRRDMRRRDYGERDMRRRDYGEEYYDRRYPTYEDYGEDDDYLDDEELMLWAKRLMREIPENEKNMFSKETIERKAKDIGIEFGKDFTFAEFYTTALMLYTDYRKVLGGGNIDLYLRLAQAWLMDDDLDIDAGEKLCAYYECIVNA